MVTLHNMCPLFLICVLLPLCTARIHKLSVTNDNRHYITVSTFGFYKQGILSVKMTNFRHAPYNENNHFGFSLDRTRTDAMSPYLDTHQEHCPLEERVSPSRNESPNSTPVMLFTMDLKDKLVRMKCNEASKCPEPSFDFTEKPVPDRQTLPLKEEIKENVHYFSLNFTITVPTEAQEGLYNLYFYNCPRYNKTDTKISFDMEIREENSNNNYLSAGQMPLPALYFMMALLCFLSGCFWVFILRHSKHPVFKIHYLMAVLVFLKSLSLLFHAMNYHFIQTKGEHVPTWAILYYVTHLLKGAVLFITIVLVGTGWNFIKHILSEKDKKIFMIVIPLQVLANVAEIIIEESEEGDIEHRTWREIFILVDLLCCGSILFPVVWSIRHLQEASHTDGKAAINLRKLKLFRHFYLMIVSYIYFTRIIVFLLKFTVPFQYEWLDEMFREMTTYVFFVLTGYRFRPAAANPYFQLSTEEEEEDIEEEMDSVVTESGVTEGLTKMSRGNNGGSGGGGGGGGGGGASNDSVEEDRVNLLSKRESSHEYD